MGPKLKRRRMNTEQTIEINIRTHKMLFTNPARNTATVMMIIHALGATPTAIISLKILVVDDPVERS